MSIVQHRLTRISDSNHCLFRFRQRRCKNIVLIKFTNEVLERYADAEFIKAFKLAQLSIEYLLMVQDRLSLREKYLQRELDIASTRNQDIQHELQTLELSIKEVVIPVSIEYSISQKTEEKGPVHCPVCREAFITIDSLTKDIKILKEMLEESRGRERELNVKLSQSLDREKEHLFMKQVSESM